MPHFIGQLTVEDRRKRVMDFWMRKRLPPVVESHGKYTKRKKAADKKLRINGKFVSSKQAISVLGMSKKEFQKALKRQTKQMIKNEREGLSKSKKKRTTKAVSSGKRKIYAEVTWGGGTEDRREIKVSNAQELLKSKKRGRPAKPEVKAGK
jgi:hypothetical protein